MKSAFHVWNTELISVMLVILNTSNLEEKKKSLKMVGVIFNFFGKPCCKDP